MAEVGRRWQKMAEDGMPLPARRPCDLADHYRVQETRCLAVGVHLTVGVKLADGGLVGLVGVRLVSGSRLVTRARFSHL